MAFIRVAGYSLARSALLQQDGAACNLEASYLQEK